MDPLALYPNYPLAEILEPNRTDTGYPKYPGLVQTVTKDPVIHDPCSKTRPPKRCSEVDCGEYAQIGVVRR